VRGQRDGKRRPWPEGKKGEKRIVEFAKNHDKGMEIDAKNLSSAEHPSEDSYLEGQKAVVSIRWQFTNGGTGTCVQNEGLKKSIVRNDQEVYRGGGS